MKRYGRDQRISRHRKQLILLSIDLSVLVVSSRCRDDEDLVDEKASSSRRAQKFPENPLAL